MNKKKIIYFIALIIMLLDQTIKIFVTKNMTLNEEIILIPNFFSLYYVKNIGAAFSILSNQRFLLILISCICLIILKEYIKKENITSKLNIFALGFVMGGILGNLFDRILYKSVIDYLAFDIFTYSFPVFNLADIAITIGTFLLIISFIIDKKEEI